MPSHWPAAERTRLRRLDREELTRWQLARLNQLLDAILPHNRLYSHKLVHARRPITSLNELAELPLTTKSELIPASLSIQPTESLAAKTGVQDVPGGVVPGSATNRTWPAERYVRYHRTSGTHGQPLVVLDTADDWQWWLDGWQFVLDAAGIDSHARVLLAFSFGPFIGFWSAFDAVAQRGALTIPTGGLSTLARLEAIRTTGATAVFCTPSYALHMAETARNERIDLRATSVRTIVVAGEPGGSVPAIRERIERAWGARVVDHAGASEVGPWGFADSRARGLYINEGLFLPEFVEPATGRPAAPGDIAELVLTTLGRDGCPVIRYRTGDLVRPGDGPDEDCRFTFLDGGVLGRADDMLIIRGVNIFPQSIEAILREFPEIAEYRMTAFKEGAMDALEVEIEDGLNDPARVARELELRLGLKIEVRCVPPSTLPRFEGKGRRLKDQRRNN